MLYKYQKKIYNPVYWLNKEKYSCSTIISLERRTYAGLLFQIARTFGAIQLHHSECRLTVVLLISQFGWFDRPWKENVWHQRSNEFYYFPVKRRSVMPTVYEVTSCHKYGRSRRCIGIIKKNEDAETRPPASRLIPKYDIIWAHEKADFSAKISYWICMTLEIFMAVNIKIVLFWNVVSCNLIDMYQHFEWNCCLQLQGRRVMKTSVSFRTLVTI